MTQTSPDANDREPVPVDRFLWERLLMMSGDLSQEDRFKLLPLGIFMDGDTGEGARPGAANLAMFGHHEETWKQLLRRAVDRGWLILRERGGSRKGPNGTRINRASRYAASVPSQVYERRKGILDAPPFRSKEAREPTKEVSRRAGDAGVRSTSLPSTPGGLPSCPAASTKEVPHASFEPPAPVDNPPAPTYEGSPITLPSTATNEAPESTKEVPEAYEGSPRGLRRKRSCASPSISPSSNSSPSIRSDRPARDAVQDRKGARWLIDNWPGVTPDIAAHILTAVRLEARRYGSQIEHLTPYLQRMHKRGDLADYVAAAFDHFDAAAAPARTEPEEDEPPPLSLAPELPRRARRTTPGPGRPVQPPLLTVIGTPPSGPRDLGLPDGQVQSALAHLTMGGRPYQARARRYFEGHDITATDAQVDAYALQLAWGTPKDRAALSPIPGISAALDQTG